jgi:hypothetical protein
LKRVKRIRKSCSQWIERLTTTTEKRDFRYVKRSKETKEIKERK